jgi:hypothetical protein
LSLPPTLPRNTLELCTMCLCRDNVVFPSPLYQAVNPFKHLRAKIKFLICLPQQIDGVMKFLAIIFFRETISLRPLKIFLNSVMESLILRSQNFLLLPSTFSRRVPNTVQDIFLGLILVWLFLKNKEKVRTSTFFTVDSAVYNTTDLT